MVPKGAGHRVVRDHPEPDLVRDEDDGHRRRGERFYERPRLAVDVASCVHEIPEPHGQAVDEHPGHAPGVRAKRGREVEGRLHGGPALPAPGAVARNPLAHFVVDRLPRRDIDRTRPGDERLRVRALPRARTAEHEDQGWQGVVRHPASSGPRHPSSALLCTGRPNRGAGRKGSDDAGRRPACRHPVIQLFSMARGAIQDLPENLNSAPAQGLRSGGPGQQEARKASGQFGDGPHDAARPSSPQAIAPRPFLATSVRSLSEAPLGRFAPRSHWLTRPVVTLRYRAKTA